MALMIDGTTGVNTWASNYGFPFPILDDEANAGSGAIGIGDYIPYHVLIGRDMTIRVLDGQPSDSDIQAALDEEWPEVEYPVPPDLENPGDDDDDEVPDEELDTDLSGSSSNPFLDSSRNSWNGSVVCAVGSTSAAPWIAAALIIPALVWRRRR